MVKKEDNKEFVMDKEMQHAFSTFGKDPLREITLDVVRDIDWPAPFGFLVFDPKMLPKEVFGIKIFGEPPYDLEEYKERLKHGFIGNIEIKPYEGKTN